MCRATSFLTIVKLAIFAQIPLPHFVSNGAQSRSASKLGLPSFHAARAIVRLAALMSHEHTWIKASKSDNLSFAKPKANIAG